MFICAGLNSYALKSNYDLLLVYKISETHNHKQQIILSSPARYSQCFFVYDPDRSHTWDQVCQSCCCVNVSLFSHVMFSRALYSFDPDVFSPVFFEWQPLLSAFYSPSCSQLVMSRVPVGLTQRVCFFFSLLSVTNKQTAMIPVLYLLSDCLAPWANRASMAICNVGPAPPFLCLPFHPLLFFSCPLISSTALSLITEPSATPASNPAHLSS